MKLRTLLVAVTTCVSMILLVACGGGEEAKTPSRNLVVQCLEHGGTGARIYQQQIPAKIGGLPAHVEIAGVGFEEGNLEYAEMSVYLFKEGGEGEEAAEMLEGEYPNAEVNIYAGGTAIGVVLPEGSQAPTPKDMNLITKCVGSEPKE